jgi:hypothetical protein
MIVPFYKVLRDYGNDDSRNLVPTILFVAIELRYLGPCSLPSLPLSDMDKNDRLCLLSSRLPEIRKCSMVGHCSEGRSMSKISFDSHLIEADTFGRGRGSKWLLSACYSHRHFI